MSERDPDLIAYRVQLEQQFLAQVKGPFSCAYAFLMGVMMGVLLWFRVRKRQQRRWKKK